MIASVGSMRCNDRTPTYFLVEWYQSGPAAESAPDVVNRLRSIARPGRASATAWLLMALAVPEDQTLFGLFHAADIDAVIDMCGRAGWPPDRISTGVQPWPAPPETYSPVP